MFLEDSGKPSLSLSLSLCLDVRVKPAYDVEAGSGWLDVVGWLGPVFKGGRGEDSVAYMGTGRLWWPDRGLSSSRRALCESSRGGGGATEGNLVLALSIPLSPFELRVCMC